MKKITWSFGFEPGTEKSNYSAKSIFQAFARIEKYWAVHFVQVSRSAQLQIVLTNRRNGKAAMWQQGRRVYITKHFAWPSVYITKHFAWPNHDYMAAAMVHELGHWLVNGGGHNADPESVMATVLTNPHVNFKESDMRWFGKLPWRSDARPWHEPILFSTQQPKCCVELCSHSAVIGRFDWARSWFSRVEIVQQVNEGEGL